jgi:hypothetical protein
VAPTQLYAFRDRPLNDVEFERLRLLLSTYRDGTGQNNFPKRGGTFPGYRDYERSLASVLEGAAPENKGVFDVIVHAAPKAFGISCKMVAFPPPHKQSSFMELSNSAAKFRRHLLASQINWATEPMLAGPAIIDLVTSWHTSVAALVDIDSSRYSVLLHNVQWTQFQIHCFPLDLKIANPRGDIHWAVEGASLNGYLDYTGRKHLLWQCYMNSGGQLKYYPPLDWADWITDRFILEQPQAAEPFLKAKLYFPDLWPEGRQPQ